MHHWPESLADPDALARAGAAFVASRTSARPVATRGSGRACVSTSIRYTEGNRVLRELTWALATRARVAIAQGEPDQADRDAHDALALAADIEAYLGISDTLECLAALAGEAGSHREAARLFGAAHGIRQRIGEVCFKVWDAGYEASMAALRNALGEQDFDSAWAEGAALSTEKAIGGCTQTPGELRSLPSLNQTC